MFLRLPLLILLILVAFCSNAQRMSTAKVDDWFSDPLDVVLDKISAATGVKFEFDRAKLSKIKYEARHFGLPLKDFLDMMLKDYRLNYFENEKGVVVIFDKLEDPRDKAVLNRANPVEPAKSYNGSAVK